MSNKQDLPRRAPRRERGFSLVELMVVVVILGLAATAVVLAIPETGGSLRAEAERFAARAKAARDTAIVESRPVSLALDAQGYTVARRIDGTWRPSGRYEWAEGTQAESAAERIRLDSTGLAEPTRVTLLRAGRQVVVEIGVDGSARVRR